MWCRDGSRAPHGTDCRWAYRRARRTRRGGASACGNRVDGRKRYLIPGLVDMHVHLFNNATRRPPNDWAFPLFVANGVTAPGKPTEELNKERYQLAMLERDYPTAERFLREIPAAAFRPLEGEPSKLMYEALLAVARGADATTVESALVAAREEIAKDLADHPAAVDLYLPLGLIDAFRGRKEDAIREGRRGIELATNSILEKTTRSRRSL